jgi:hypothetical protein
MVPVVLWPYFALLMDEVACTLAAGEAYLAMGEGDSHHISTLKFVSHISPSRTGLLHTEFLTATAFRLSFVAFHPPHFASDTSCSNLGFLGSFPHQFHRRIIWKKVRCMRHDCDAHRIMEIKDSIPW